MARPHPGHRTPSTEGVIGTGGAPLEAELAARCPCTDVDPWTEAVAVRDVTEQGSRAGRRAGEKSERHFA